MRTIKGHLRLILNNVEIPVNCSVEKEAMLEDLLVNIGAERTYAKTFKLTRPQYAEFSTKAINIIYS